MRCHPLVFHCRRLCLKRRQLNHLCLVLLAVFALEVGGPALAQDRLEAQGLRFRLIPGGTYFLGSPLSEAGRYHQELTPYRVSLKAFYLAETETTNEEYGRFLKATGRPAPAYWHDPAFNRPRQPVVGVTFEDARAYCVWLTRVTGVRHRLPTEAEWEAAARGGLIGEPYPWGREAPDAGGRFRANYNPDTFARDGYRFTAPVGAFPPNGYGLFDMAGNVAEWCAEAASPPGRPTPFAAPEYRVAKGGSWYSRARDLRCAARQLVPPHTADGYIGFRVLRETALP
jgi:formylglycine-generating enzyme required for sulfatase activity